MFIPAIDKLCATVDIKDYEVSTSDLILKLEQKKNEAKMVAANNASQKTLINIGTQTFEIYPIGTRGYAYILRNDGYEVKISQYRAKNKDFFPIFIDVSSEYLWNKGPKESWDIITKWLKDNFGEVVGNKINRIDLCCHTDEISLTEEDCKTFEGKFHEDTIFRHRRKVNAMCFGSRKNQKIYCRIYNKTLETEKQRKKLWFKNIWSSRGMDITKVWNIEFEIKREFFKEVKIDTVEDAFERIKSLWDYCTKTWLIKKNNDRSRIERSTISEKWNKLQEAFTDYESKEMIKREKQLEVNAMALLPGTIGNITSFAARAGITDIDKVVNIIKTNGHRMLLKKETSYEEIIGEKMNLLGF